MAIRHFGGDCVFLTNEEGTARGRVKEFGFEGYTLGPVESWGADDLAKTFELALSHGCAAIVADSDYEGPDYLAQLRKRGFFVCAIEDIAPHSFGCQLVVNGDVHARQLPYGSSSGDTIFLLGPEYAILRDEFQQRPKRVVSDRVENILVTFGGADPYNLTPNVLRLLKKLPGSFSVTAIIGPFFENVSEVESEVGGGKRAIGLIHSPRSVRNLMVQADLAISAGGQTLYELACVGCPSIAVRTAANQDGQLEVFEQAGFIRLAGRGDDDRIVDLVGDAMLPLLTDSKVRGAMSAAGQRLIDGKGALRVARTILGAIST
jgi:spore coat polysaccharide biosynthesis predicted glycosyltransferase SpsG